MNFDQSNYSELMQKNYETMVKANQVSSENVQSIMKRAAEIAQKHVGEAIEVSKDVMSSSNPEQAMQKQQAYFKSVTSNAVNNSKELVEMAAKSLMEVYDVLGKRTSENMEAVNHAVKKSK